jgi:perosamine synthetase
MRERASIPAILGGERAVAERGGYRWPIVSETMTARVAEALRSDLVYGCGSITRQFEDAFADYHGRAHAVACCSGTVALLAAYFGVGLGSDALSGGSVEEVIVPAYGFFATVSALLYLGVRPVFCDVEEATGNIDPNEVARLLSPRTRAIVVTHVAGHPANMEALTTLAGSRGIPLVEDGSHAHGSTFMGRRVGTFGAAAAFSFQAGKMVCGGEGGAVLVDDDDALLRVAALVNVRRLEGTNVDVPAPLGHTGLGLKLRMGPLEAALARYHLGHLDELVADRARDLGLLSEGLASAGRGIFRVPETRKGTTRGAFYEYSLRYERAAEERLPLSAFRAALAAEGVEFARSNTRAVHRLSLFRDGLGHAIRALGVPRVSTPAEPGWSFPVADRIERETLCLPTFTRAPEALLRSYVSAFKKVCAHFDDIAQDYVRHADRYRPERGS